MRQQGALLVLLSLVLLWLLPGDCAEPVQLDPKFDVEEWLEGMEGKGSGPCFEALSLEGTNSSTYDEICNMGITFMQQADAQEGFNCFLKARQMQPEVPRANVLLSFVLKDQDGCDKVVPLMQRSLEVNPTHGEMLTLLGQCLSKLGHYEEAVEALIKALGYEPSILAYYELGNCYRALGDVDTAVSIFHEASSKFDSGDDVWFAEIGRTLQTVGRFEEALIYMSLTVVQQPGNAYYHYNLASLYEKMAKFDEALESLEKCLEIKNDLVDAHKRKGNIFLKLGRQSDAVQSYKDALVIVPEDQGLIDVITRMEKPSWWNDVDVLVDELGDSELEEESTTTSDDDKKKNDEKPSTAGGSSNQDQKTQPNAKDDNKQASNAEKTKQAIEEQEDEEWW